MPNKKMGRPRIYKTPQEPFNFSIEQEFINKFTRMQKKDKGTKADFLRWLITEENRRRRKK